MTTGPQPTADLLYGVGAIAEFLGIKKRAAYHLIDQKRIPTFKLGKTVCAKRSVVAGFLDSLGAEGGQ